jgi:hypothetical protein
MPTRKGIFLGTRTRKNRRQHLIKLSPRSATPGTQESHHVDEGDGPSHTSPTKDSSPDGQKKEKQR